MLALYQSDPTTGTKPYPHVSDVLYALQERGDVFAVITNKNLDPAKKILSTCFPNIRFESVYSPDQGWEAKPSQMSILDFRKRHPAETLTYVGDTEIDWQTAEGVADKTFIATWGYRTRDELLAKGVPESTMINDLRQILD